MFIDTHSHLFYPNFEDDLDEVIQRARDSGVDFILVPATDLATAKEVINLTEKYDMRIGLFLRLFSKRKTNRSIQISD